MHLLKHLSLLFRVYQREEEIFGPVEEPQDPSFAVSVAFGAHVLARLVCPKTMEVWQAKGACMQQKTVEFESPTGFALAVTPQDPE